MSDIKSLLVKSKSHTWIIHTHSCREQLIKFLLPNATSICAPFGPAHMKTVFRLYAKHFVIKCVRFFAVALHI
jgi:hypothetical protein